MNSFDRREFEAAYDGLLEMSYSSERRSLAKKLLAKVIAAEENGDAESLRYRIEKLT